MDYGHLVYLGKNQIQSLQLYKEIKKRESCDCLVLMCKKKKKTLKNTAGVTLRGLQKQGMGAPACANTVFYTSRLTKKVQTQGCHTDIKTNTAMLSSQDCISACVCWNVIVCFQCFFLLSSSSFSSSGGLSKRRHTFFSQVRKATWALKETEVCLCVCFLCATVCASALAHK